MISRPPIALGSSYFRRYLLRDGNKCAVLYNTRQERTHTVFCKLYAKNLQKQVITGEKNALNSRLVTLVALYSRGLLDGDFTSPAAKNLQDCDTTKLFPQPRVTLNELASKVSGKVFHVHYKQSVGKVARKSVQTDWVCTYDFVWPESMKFESTALSKKQAAERAAAQALDWLYSKKRINQCGHPVHDRDKLSEIRSTLNEPITAKIGDNSLTRIERIWTEYERDIKHVYERTHKNAMRNLHKIPAVITKDSSMEEEDELTENRADAENDMATSGSELKSPVHPVYCRPVLCPTVSQQQRRQRALDEMLRRYEEGMLPLPIDEYASQIAAAVASNPVTILVGAPGCGKSTRAPAAILNHRGHKMAALVCEPRRIAAVGLAGRVASEFDEEVGETVGYQVRLDSKPPAPRGGAILYCTSGILLRRLQLNPGLQGCTHVFIDEAHERDANTDLTLLLLKRALTLNPDLKVIVMSATLDVDVFTRYFNTSSVIEVPGRTFPVQVTHLDDMSTVLGDVELSQTRENCREDKPRVSCQEVVSVIKAIDSKMAEGAILVFLPGWAEILSVQTALAQELRRSSTHLILPVHSRLSTEDQSKIFTHSLPGVRKIVLATNIAETSVTIPDVTCVLDCGARRENWLRDGGVSCLDTVWVSRAATQQRAGRAGRVQPGHCFRMYTKDKEAEFAEHSTPEILRIPLVQTVLNCKTYAPDDKAGSFLSQLPEPPSPRAIKIAVNDLVDLGALTPSEQLTALGSHLTHFTLHPRLACCQLHSAVLGNVLSVANVTADTGDVFHSNQQKEAIRATKRKYSATSDHTALHRLLHEYEEVRAGARGERAGVVRGWGEERGVRGERLQYVTALSSIHLQQLLKSGFLEPNPDIPGLNRFSDCDELTAAALLSGCNSLLVTRRVLKTKGKMAVVMEAFTSTGDRAHIASESVNAGVCKPGPTQSGPTHSGPTPRLLAYFGGHHSNERRALVVYKSSLVTPEMVLMFCKGDVRKELIPGAEETLLVLHVPRHRLEISLPSRHAEAILKAREMLWSTFQYYYERDTRDLDVGPDSDETISRFKIRLVKAIRRILVEARKGQCGGDMSDLMEDDDLDDHGI